MFYLKISLTKYVYKTWYSHALFIGDTVYIKSGKDDLPDGARRITEAKFNEIATSLHPAVNDGDEVN